jgi:putative ABC transport system substrate-binding protein
MSACGNGKTEEGKIKIGFVEAFEDPTLEQAKTGFFDGLKEGGFSEEKGNMKVLKKNAQGDFPALVQAIDFLSKEKVSILATSATLTSVTAVKKNHDIPVFMMVAPEPCLAGLCNSTGAAPANLFGVYERLGYIDTSFNLIREVMPDLRVLGISYNPAETQSTDAFEHMKILASQAGITLESVAISNSSETAQALSALTERKIDAFFAMPDNTIFASFELIKKICNSKGIPIFTSEAGLVARGALCAYGADIYAWGRQSGKLAAAYLSGERDQKKLLQEVILRNRVFNPETARIFTKIKIPSGYKACAHE